MEAYTELLKNRGEPVFSDWPISDNADEIPEYHQYLDVVPEDIRWQTVADVTNDLQRAGFSGVRHRHRRAAYVANARRDLAIVEGRMYPKLLALVGETTLAQMIAVRRANTAAAEAGALRPVCFYGRKS